MSRPALRRPGTSVDPACPIDWSHPLSVGLVSELAVVPNSGWRGGLTLRDLVRGGHNPNDGTLTNMSFPPTATSGWQGARGRNGGYGSLAFDGTDDYVSVASNSSLQPTTAVTCAVWVNFKATGAMSILTKDSDTNERAYTLDTYLSAARFYINGAVGVVNGNTTLTTGTWYHIVGTYDSANASTNVYLNGLLDAAAGGGAAINTGNSTVQIGAREYSTNRDFTNGLIASAMIWKNRVLSAAEVAALYAETRRGNPERWRWLGRRAWGVTVAAAATGGGRDLLSQGGVLGANLLGNGTLVAA